MSELASLIDRLVEPDRPTSPALVGASGRVERSRGELASRIRASAAAYARAGLAPGTRVAFGVRQDAEGIAWLIGALRAGVVPVVLESSARPAVQALLLRDAQVAGLVVGGGLATALHHRSLRVALARLGLPLPAASALGPITWSTSTALAPVRRLERRVGEDARHPLDDRAPALVVFTSGSTGIPRGVIYGGGGLAALFALAASSVVALPDDAVVLGGGLHLTLPALLAGVPVVLGGPRDPARLARFAQARGVTHLSLPAHRALAFARSGGSARFLLLGSAPVRNVTLAELAARMPRTQIRCVYGLTECLLVAMIDAPERLAHDERAGDLVGRPLPGIELRAGADGEIRVRGAALALGYLGLEGPLDEIATGDLGRLDGSGRLVLLGRRKEMLIRDGENIYPSLYEAELARLAGLEAAVMVGLPDAHADELVVAFAVPHAGESSEAARARLAALITSPVSPLDRHAVPDAVLAIAQLPRSGRSGKPDRARLARIAADQLGRTLEDEAGPRASKPVDAA